MTLPHFPQGRKSLHSRGKEQGPLRAGGRIELLSGLKFSIAGPAKIDVIETSVKEKQSFMPDSFDYSQPRQVVLNRRPFQPTLTVLLCGLSVLITAAFLTSDVETKNLWYRIGHFGSIGSFDLWDGRFWGLFTCIFMHGDLMHIAFNLYWLWQLGQLIEAEIGGPRYALIVFTAAGLLRGRSRVVRHNRIGMSGVVYALFGLMWAARGSYPYWQRVATHANLNLFLGWGLFCVFGTYLGFMRIANGAHAAGLLYGLSIGWLFFAPRRRPLWAIPLSLLALLTVLALTWMPWSSHWTFWKGNHDFVNRRYRSAIGWYKRSLSLGGDREALWENISHAWSNIAYYAYRRNDLVAEAHAVQESEAAMRRLKQLQGAPTREP